jgi:hypothetical protein
LTVKNKIKIVIGCKQGIYKMTAGLNKKTFYVGLNLVAPGAAQLALGWWLRGLIQLGGAVLSIIWFAWIVLGPIIVSTMNLLKDEQHGEIRPAGTTLSLLILPVLSLAVIWIWSYIDLLVFYRQDEQTKIKNQGDKEKTHFRGES